MEVEVSNLVPSEGTHFSCLDVKSTFTLGVPNVGLTKYF